MIEGAARSEARTSSSGHRPIARGQVFVDAPRGQRIAGLAIALASPLVLVGLLGVHANVHTAVVALSAWLLLYFGGIALAAGAGRSLEAKAGRRQQRGVLFEADGQLLVLTESGSLSFPMAGLAGTEYDPDQRRLIVLTECGARIEIEAPTEARASEIRTRLGLEGGPAVLGLSAQGRAGRILEGLGGGLIGFFGCLFCESAALLFISAIAGLGGPATGLAFLLAVGVTPAIFVLLSIWRGCAPIRVVLGSDGVRIGSKKPLYIPYQDLESVQPFEHGALLRRKDGGDHFVRTAEPKLLAASIARRLDDAPPESRRLPALQRGEEGLERWRCRLAAVTHGREGYRVGHVDTERLAEVVEDPRAGLDERVGAAFVLGGADDREAVARARRAARVTAEPHAREAIERALEGELEDAEIPEARRTAQRSWPEEENAATMRA